MSYKFAIIGYPIQHSLSPVIQKAALESVGLDGTYEIIETRPENLVSVVKTLKSQGYHGFNVTIPHKVPITLFLEQFDDFANVSGSVNTVKITEEKTLYGYNTDVYGFMRAIPKNCNLQGSTVAVMGTGGAARGVCAALNELGVQRIDMYSRNVADSHIDVEGIRTRFKDLKVNLYQYQMLYNLNIYKMVVNTTPIGMTGHSQGTSILTDEIVSTLPSDSYIYDIIYTPSKTELIKQAIRNGRKYISGLDMLIYQGAKAFEIWTGETPDIDKMKIAALEYLS